MNLFARMFVGANRLFGAVIVLFGVVAFGSAIYCLVRGQLGGAASYALVGLILVACGLLYLNAPLSRVRPGRRA